jgi:hypothetical protein
MVIQWDFMVKDFTATPKRDAEVGKIQRNFVFFKHFWHLYGVYSNYVELL